MECFIDDIVERILVSYRESGGINHIDGTNLPSREGVGRIVEDLVSLVFPGFQEEECLDEHNVRYAIAEKVARLVRRLAEETEKSLAFLRCVEKLPTDPEACRRGAAETSRELAGLIPVIRERVRLDVAAAFRGDPAAKSFEEIIVAYPGVEAVMIHRFAHELWVRGVPLIPRMMSERIHGKTGIDIHPGATIGASFFIDHGTGVVIGETTVIGDNVKLYQGVTLGAVSVHKNESDKKRHPTVEDNVTIYAGATILGGDTVIGRGSVIGGNVWITSSIPPSSRVYYNAREFIYAKKDVDGKDFQI